MRIKFLGVLLTEFLFLLGPGSFSLLGAKKSPPIISRITIRATDIFDFESSPNTKKLPYTWINALHIRTVERVIERELLFKVGDKLDLFLIRETERNLRSLPFIRGARIARYPQRDGTVALVVFTSDSWTTEPQINLGGINSIDKKEIGFKEKNLFGLGKSISFFYNKSDDTSEREYTYTDPRVWGSRWQFKAQAVNKDDGDKRNVNMTYPFYSTDSRWTTGAWHEVDTSVIGEFVNNTRVSEFEQTKEINEVFGGMKIGSRRDFIFRTGPRYRKEIRDSAVTDKTNLQMGIPEKEKLKTIFLDTERTGIDFMELTRLEKMTRVEDVNMGSSWRLSPGFSPNVGQSEDTVSFQSTFEDRYLIKNEHLAQTKLEYSGRKIFNGGDNQKYSLLFKYYHQLSDDNTLVFNTRIEGGEKLDSDNLIELGSENGLRGFKTDSIVGTKSWLFNIENRTFFIEELWNLFSIGSAVFLDSGYVWGRGEPIRLSQLRSEVGGGLRIGLTKSSNEVILRLDVSYRLHRVHSSDSEWVFSFGTGQGF